MITVAAPSPCLLAQCHLTHVKSRTVRVGFGAVKRTLTSSPKRFKFKNSKFYGVHRVIQYGSTTPIQVQLMTIQNPYSLYACTSKTIRNKHQLLPSPDVVVVLRAHKKETHGSGLSGAEKQGSSRTVGEGSTMGDSALTKEDYGVETSNHVYFRNEHNSRTFKPFHEEDDVAARGLVPPDNKIYEHAASPKENVKVEDLKLVAKDLGCIAFASHSGRLFVRLPAVETWVKSASAEEVVYVVTDNAPPWHHVDVTYDVQEDLRKSTFESFSVEVEFSHDVPTTHNLYLCIFGGHSNLGGFYGGFQTKVGCPGDSLGQARVDPAPGLIFSRWGPALPQDVCLTSSASFREVDTYEGSFASVRHQFPWKKGRYRLSLVSRRPIEEGTWVDFQMVELSSDTVCQVGGLFFRGKEPLVLGKTLYSFVEIYGPDKRYLEPTFPQFSMHLSAMQLNGKLVNPRVRALYFKESPLYVTAYLEKDQDDSSANPKWKVLLRFGKPFCIHSYGKRCLRKRPE